MTSSAGAPAPFMGSGVKQDLHLLFNKYSALNSTRIRDFAEVFRELRFETILHYRTSPAEFTEFAEYLLQNAALYFGSENEVCAKRSFAERIFGIYLCCALYNLQPVDHVCQIPVTETQFKDLMEFQKVLISVKALEPIAALKQLCLKKAFRFMIFQSTYDPATHRRYMAEDEMPDFGRKPIEPFAGVKAVLSHRTMGQIEFIHNSYVEAKKKLGLTDIQLVDKVNPVAEIKNHFEKRQNELDTAKEGGEAATSVLGRVLAPESAGTSRSNLRSRAYAAKMKHSRHRRHLDPNMEENFKHLTFGQIAQECIADSRQGSSTQKPKPPRRKKVVKEEPMQMDDDDIAAEVLREEYASRVKPELFIDEVDDTLSGGKIGKQGTSGVAKIRAPKRKAGNLMVVKSEQRDSPDAVPSASQIANEFNTFTSPEKKTRRGKAGSTAKPRISDEWSSKLHKWSGQLQSTDNELKKLTSSIKMEEIDDT